MTLRCDTILRDATIFDGSGGPRRHGDVAISGELTIEEGATVTGEIGAGTVIVGGTLRGDVAARGAVTLRATAQVEGNMGGAEVSLEEGASFHGRIDAEFDMPAELGGHEGAPRAHAANRGR